MILKTDNMTMQFGGVTAVNALSIEIPENKIVALIGPNGAGKTTAFNMITGVYKPTSGTILYKDTQINGKKPSYITTLGVARTFQNIRLYKDLTVFENVIISKHLRLKSNLFQSVFRFSKNSPYNIEEKMFKEETEELLNKINLWDLKDSVSTSLPYGKQRRLEIARALATNPKLLLLDEPAAGMNPSETLELTRFIEKIREEFNLTIFMIEHHMDLVMDISDYIYVLDFGTNIAKGTPFEIQNNQKVIDAYLGCGEDA